MSALRVRDLTVRYGSFTAVQGVGFEVERGHVLGLVGESGSGKSTIARAIAGLTAYSGRIDVDDRQIEAGASRASRRSRRRIQMVFQDPSSSLDPRFTASRSISEALSRPGGDVVGNRRARVRELLEMVGLDETVNDSRPAQLSGGQLQRVAIARALAARPQVLIADEITASLDVSVQAMILNLLRNIQRELGLTMVFVSHNLAVVRYLSDHVAVLYRGRIVEYGPATDVIARPEHPYTRVLLEAVPQVGGALPRDRDDPAVAEGAEPAEPEGGCAFRLRCPVGPVRFPDREICVDTDPADSAQEKRHHASCHFAARTSGAGLVGSDNSSVGAPAGSVIEHGDPP